MNKVYRHIWLKTLKGGRRTFGALLASTALFSSFPVYAQNVLPSGGQVVSGQATITTNGNAMTVDQATDRMIANWQGFSIGAGNSVTFNQPETSSVALNRVVGQDPSQIRGALSANGQVFLINPNGIVIGKNGSVKTGGFVASTLGITNQDFLSGNYRFTGTGGSIVNDGTINGNVVALISPSITNAGTITGSTALAAGTDVLLDFDGDGLLSVEVKGSTVKTLVENKGLIKADGGKAILTAKGASDAMKGVVNNSGTIEAKAIGKKNGRILLLGDMEHGEVKISGKLDASAPKGGDGGFIETSARKVKIADMAVITTEAASGATGTWLIDPDDFTIAASGGDITGTALSTQLANNNVTIQSSSGGTSGNGDINVNDSVSWSAHTLTLTAARDIDIGAVMTATGSSALAMNTGTANGADAGVSGGTVKVTLNSTGFSGSVDFDRNGTGFLTINGDAYTVINDVTALQDVNNSLSGNYVLGANINATDTANWNSGSGFVPIGNSGARYTGVFDGLGHRIFNLTIDRETTDYVGLFGTIEGATIRNVSIFGGSISGRQEVGALVGANFKGTIQNSSVVSNVSGDTDVGGLAGLNRGTVENAWAGGSVSGKISVGGLVGWNSSISDGATTISSSYATGAVSGVGSGSGIGGLVGLNHGTVRNSYATGSVDGEDSAAIGGLVGSNWATIENSYATGSASADQFVGGLVGNNLGTVRNSYATGSVSGSDTVGGLMGSNSLAVENSYATGSVSGSGSVGGLMAGNSGTVINSFWNTETSGQAASAGGVGKTSAALQDPFTFIDAGWDFANIWGKSTSGENSGYMMLRGVGSGTLYDAYVNVSGTATTIYGTPASTAGLSVTGVNANAVTLGWNGTATNARSYNLANVLNLSSSTGESIYTGSISGTLIINKAALTVTANGLTKSYNGQVFAGGNGVSYSGFVNGETASVLSGSPTYSGTSQAARNAGNYTITASGLFSSNYTISYANGALTINPAALTISTANVSKTYDGGTSASGTAVVKSGQLFGTDSLSGGSFAFADNNAGTGKTVTVSGVSINDGNNGGNYAVSYAANTTSSINKAALTVTADSLTRAFDGQAFSGGNGVSYSGFVNGETASVLSGSLAYGGTSQAARNAGNYTITASGLSSSNYTISYANGALTINPAALTISLADIVKTYDGNTSASGTAVVASGQLFGTDALSGGSFAFTDKNAGTGKTVTVSAVTLSDGNNGGNYSVTYAANTTSTINQAVITGITGVTASNKTYDATTAATLDTSGAVFNGMVAGDSLAVAGASGSFGDKNAGAGKTVVIDGLALGGADAGNYTLADTTATATANILRAVISGVAGITANNKTYDATIAATLDTSGAVFNGMASGDSLTVASATGAFGDKNAGAGKTVGINSLALGGADAGNYILADTTATATADIDKALLALSGFTAANKAYDGTTVATIANTGILVGVIAGDSVAFGHGGASFSDKNAGTAKTVTLGGVSLNGADAGNYTIAATATTTADIDKALLALSGFTAANKTYDGTAIAMIANAGSLVGVVSGDSVSFGHGDASFQDKNAGSAKTVTLDGVSLNGADSGNYTIAGTATITADIARTEIAAITGITAKNKAFDGTTTAALDLGHAGFSGIIAGDGLTVATATGRFVDALPGANKTVTIIGLSLGGSDAANYTLGQTVANASADIEVDVAPPLTPQQQTGAVVEGGFFEGSASGILRGDEALIDLGQSMSDPASSAGCVPDFAFGIGTPCAPQANPL
ncbi:YDG domain-containing protein [Mesorhizobium sp. M0621]|uniref:beta strand repeat-containing protein n=1 Tax=Mesorhizobium sp. M0621 TaxID=2956974 RepID=UPI00333D69DA